MKKILIVNAKGKMFKNQMDFFCKFLRSIQANFKRKISDFETKKIKTKLERNIENKC